MIVACDTDALRANQRWGGYTGSILPGSATPDLISGAVEPGQKVARFEGRKAITNLRVKVRLPERPQDVDVLRELTIAM